MLKLQRFGLRLKAYEALVYVFKPSRACIIHCTMLRATAVDRRTLQCPQLDPTIIFSLVLGREWGNGSHDSPSNSCMVVP